MVAILQMDTKLIFINDNKGNFSYIFGRMKAVILSGLMFKR